MPQHLDAVAPVEFAADLVGDLPAIWLDPPHWSQREAYMRMEVALIAVGGRLMDHCRVRQAERIEHRCAEMRERRDHFGLAHVAVERRDAEQLDLGVGTRARLLHRLPAGTDLDPVVAHVADDHRLAGRIE